MNVLSPYRLAIILPASILAIDVSWRFVQRKAPRKGLPLPPGPINIPIIGSMLSIDREAPWKTYTAWHAIYDLIVLGSRTVAVQLLEKRSRMYSNRPFVATLEPYGVDMIFAFTPYGENWRSCRRIAHQTFRMDASLTLRPMQLRKSLELALSMIQNPDQFEHHYTIFSTSVSLSATYGHEPKAEEDPLIDIYEAYTTAAVPAATPEKATMLKLFPFLLNIPDWFPGSRLKREAKYARGLSVRLTEMPYRYTEECIVDLTLPTRSRHPIVSLASDHISKIGKHADRSNQAEHVSILKKAAVSSFMGTSSRDVLVTLLTIWHRTAASGTTASSLMVFTEAMVTHPHIWKRAQAEIDSVVGTDRIPSFDDRSALPYIDAIIRETVRWRPVVPLGIWHATTDSDVYTQRYVFISHMYIEDRVVTTAAGATIIANIWAMSRDERQYPNAEKFTPERFLNDDGTSNNNVENPMDFVFGFGRRVCPGRYFADASLFIAIATMLSLFEFHAPEGDGVAVETKCVNGVTRRPQKFPYHISARPHVNEAYLERLHSELESSQG